MRVKLENGKELSFNPATQYKYITHGYALTDYKSQGKTEKHVIYHADTTKGVNFNQAYVGVTRGKESVTIYTDDKKQLYRQVEREQNKTSTLDYDLTAAKAAHEQRLIAIKEKIPSITDESLIAREKMLLGRTDAAQQQKIDQPRDVDPQAANNSRNKSKEFER